MYNPLIPCEGSCDGATRHKQVESETKINYQNNTQFLAHMFKCQKCGCKRVYGCE